jgi:thiosulfate dehydrogenase
MWRLFAAIIIVLFAIGALRMLSPRSERGPLMAAGGKPVSKDSALWTAPDSQSMAASPDYAMISYGRSLIVGTSNYFGPRGKLGETSNGMNCQNCHLDAGTRPWGNNYGGVYSTYPKFRERRGAVETICQRVNDCFQRSLNGKALDSTGPEMQAILAYLKWLGRGLVRGQKPKGSGLAQLKFLDRAADPARGEVTYALNCAICHGPSGEGKLDTTGISYLYPPLWGDHSFTTAAGLYRLSRMAGYIKVNMPFGTTWRFPALTDEQAWDLAAFINSKPRPNRTFSQDWPDRSLKPVDHPFGPYTDSFSERQHKYGPFGPIQQAHLAAQANLAAQTHPPASTNKR